MGYKYNVDALVGLALLAAFLIALTMAVFIMIAR